MALKLVQEIQRNFLYTQNVVQNKRGNYNLSIQT
jgi:hypothetical protein